MKKYSLLLIFLFTNLTFSMCFDDGLFKPPPRKKQQILTIQWNTISSSNIKKWQFNELDIDILEYQVMTKQGFLRCSYNTKANTYSCSLTNKTPRQRIVQMNVKKNKEYFDKLKTMYKK